MKRMTTSLALAAALLTLTATAFAEPWRQGVSLGGTHFLGYDIELPIGPLALETSVGIVELAPSIAESLKKYYPLSSTTVFFGGGLWQIVAVTPNEGGMINLVRGVAGAEWSLPRRRVWGLELGLNYPFGSLAFWGRDQIQFNRKVLLPIPRLYYRSLF